LNAAAVDFGATAGLANRNSLYDTSKDVRQVFSVNRAMSSSDGGNRGQDVRHKGLTLVDRPKFV
jgi:hypothetical protein